MWMLCVLAVDIECMCKDLYMQVLLWLLHLLSVTCCPFRVVLMMMQHVQ